MGRRFARRLDEAGASAVEYALLIAGIVTVLVLAIAALGGTTAEQYDDGCDEISQQMSGETC